MIYIRSPNTIPTITLSDFQTTRNSLVARNYVVAAIPSPRSSQLIILFSIVKSAV